MYFAEQPARTAVRGRPQRRGEVDRPAPADPALPSYHYDGVGGIPLSDPLRRAAFAARFGDLKLLFTETSPVGRAS